MSIEVKLDLRNLHKMEKRLPGITEQIVQKLAQDTEKEAKKSMEGSKSGIIYGSHQASAPGEAPAVDTGNLKSSIVARKKGRRTWEVRVGAKYAHWLEYGTEHMAARPFMLPAVRKVVKDAPKEIVKKVRDGLR